MKLASARRKCFYPVKIQGGKTVICITPYRVSWMYLQYIILLLKYIYLYAVILTATGQA